MYAQCPECLTFFRVKPEQLKAAHGKVRCSQCKHVFNALETLRGDLSAEELRAVREARSDNAHDSGKERQAAKADENGDLFAQLDYTANEELPLDDDEAAPQLDDNLAADELAEEVAGDEPGIDQRAAELADFDEENREQLESRTGLTERMGDEFANLPRTDFSAPRRHPFKTALLLLANLLLLTALAAQFMHHERRELLAHPEIGPYLSEAYDRIGFEVAPPRDIAAIRVSRTNVASHPEFSSTLLLTAVLENRAGFEQPWPLLRIDLQDRWGDTVGARYFEPREYLKNPAEAAGLMPQGEPQAAALAIADPGPDAVGFQVEPCMKKGNRKLCTSDLR